MKKLIIAACCLMGIALTGMSAQAVTISYGDGYYVGYIWDSIPADPTLELGYITNLISLGPGASATTIGTETYNRIDSTLVGSLPNPTSFYYGLSSQNSWVSNFSGSAYILGKYDGPNAGALVWLVNIQEGTTYTVPQNWPYPNKYGISQFNIFATNAVPEPSTLLLLGAGLLGLAGVSRRMKG
jgi:hypothetical protein